MWHECKGYESTAENNPLIDYGPYGERLIVEDISGDDVHQQVLSKVKNNGFYLSTNAYHQLNMPYESQSHCKEQSVETIYTVRAKAGEALCMTKYVIYSVDEKIGELASSYGETLLKEVSRTSFEIYEQKQRAILAEFWDNTDVVIEGDDMLLQGLRFNFFHIFQSTGRDGKTSVGAKGLSGEGYEGHYFGILRCMLTHYIHIPILNYQSFY